MYNTFYANKNNVLVAKIVLLYTFLFFSFLAQSEQLNLDGQINLYRGHGVLINTLGLEPTVMVETGLVKVWYTKIEYKNASFAPGQSKYGSEIYPFANPMICYMELSAPVFEKNIKNNLPLNWKKTSHCESGLSEGIVFKSQNHTFNLIAKNNDGNLSWLTSKKGLPGTWKLISKHLIQFDHKKYVFGNSSIFYAKGEWHLLLEYADWNQWKVWRISHWSGSSLDNLKRVDSDDLPAIKSDYSVAGGQVISIDGLDKFALITHQSLVHHKVVPTGIGIWITEDAGKNWIQNRVLLTPKDIKYFAGNYNKKFDDDSQLADPTVFEINNTTYMMYETIWHEVHDIPTLSIAWWESSFSKILQKSMK